MIILQSPKEKILKKLMKQSKIETGINIRTTKWYSRKKIGWNSYHLTLFNLIPLRKLVDLVQQGQDYLWKSLATTQDSKLEIQIRLCQNLQKFQIDLRWEMFLITTRYWHRGRQLELVYKSDYLHRAITLINKSKNLRTYNHRTNSRIRHQNK